MHVLGGYVLAPQICKDNDDNNVLHALFSCSSAEDLLTNILNIDSKLVKILKRLCTTHVLGRYVLACHPGGGWAMGGEDMQSLYLHGKLPVEGPINIMHVM
jgi:hypothetical protein